MKFTTMRGLALVIAGALGGEARGQDITSGPSGVVTSNAIVQALGFTPQNAAGVVSTITQTNFVLNTVYVNTSGGPIILDGSVQTVVAAVTGNASFDVMVDQSGGTTFTRTARLGMNTTASSIAQNYTNSFSCTVSNGGKYYMTNSSNGAGNSTTLVPSTGQITVLGGPVAGGNISGTFSGNAAGLTNVGGVAYGVNNAVVRGVNYSSITQAKAVAVAGDTIYVYPGTYHENNLLKAGVNYFFYPGAIVDYQENNVESAGLGIFDDRPVGNTTNEIGGMGVFRFSEPTYEAGLGNPNFMGAVTITNTSSRLVMQCVSIGVSNFNQAGSAVAALRQTHGYVSVTADWMGDLAFPIHSVTDPGDPGSDLANVGYGVWWAKGECYINVRQMTTTGGYCVWGDGPNDASTVANLWFNADAIETPVDGLAQAYYMSGRTGDGYRTWVHVKNITGGGNVLGGGRHYLQVDKMAQLAGGYAFAAAADSGVSPTVWLTAQKLTSTNATTGLLHVEAGTVYANVMQYEMLGTGGYPIQNIGGNVFEGQSQFFAGASGNTALAASTTYYFSPNFYSATLPTTDVSGGTRSPVTRACNLRNLYVTLSADPGNTHTYAFTVMTNGTASHLTCTVTGNGTTSLTGRDTTNVVFITPGVEVGLRCVVGASATGAKVNWAFEGK